MNRREFLTAAAANATALAGVPSIASPGRPRKRSAADKLNVALIGSWGRGQAHYDALAEENVVALCDVNEIRFADALKRFPSAKTFFCA